MMHRSLRQYVIEVGLCRGCPWRDWEEDGSGWCSRLPEDLDLDGPSRPPECPYGQGPITLRFYPRREPGPIARRKGVRR